MELTLHDKLKGILKIALCGLLLQCSFLTALFAKEAAVDNDEKASNFGFGEFIFSRNVLHEGDKTSALQDFTVRGKVSSEENGEPLPGTGVNILVKGTSIGTVTDFAGNYNINVSEDAILVFSFIVFNSIEIPVSGRTVVDLVMTSQASQLSEVVVVGYGTVQKRDLTGSVSSLNAEDFNPGIQTSVDQLIQGRTAGVQITQTSAEPGGGVTIRVRGATSLTAGNEPLYVIDGLPIDNSNIIPESAINNDRSPRNPLNALNPGDIASIDLIDDVRGSAGVAEVPLGDFGGKDELRDFILDERGREFHTEALRRQDLIRYGKFIQMARDRGKPAEDYHVWYPIPLTQIDKNVNLEQNDGYN